MSLFLVISQRTGAFREDVIPDHLRYLRKLGTQGKIELSGPFADRSGGAYLLQSASLEEAMALIGEDPLFKSGASAPMVREWLAHPPEAK